MSETIELKPCPFCGSDGAKTTGRDNNWWVYCDTCGVEMMGGSPTRAARMWNRRHTDAAPGEAELGRELIAWAAEEPTFWNSARMKRVCVFCKRNILPGHHADDCLHLRARALRDSDAG